MAKGDSIKLAKDQQCFGCAAYDYDVTMCACNWYPSDEYIAKYGKTHWMFNDKVKEDKHEVS